MAKKISIAIDGPAGAGKSTIARRLAAELGYHYVDTGAIYRTVAYFFDLWGVSPKDIDGITRYIDELTIRIEYDAEGVQHMIMNGMDVTKDIRTQEISQKASIISAHAIVRDMLLDMQREVAEQHDVIMDGRDIGSVVLPKATVKFFLTASPEVRARRRTKELLEKGQKADYEKILKEIQQRDFQDTHREVAPLKMTRDSIKLDTSDMGIDQVIAAMKETIAKKVAHCASGLLKALDSVSASAGRLSWWSRPPGPGKRWLPSAPLSTTAMWWINLKKWASGLSMPRRRRCRGRR